MSATTHDEFFDTLLTDFLDESDQLLERLNENLLELDESVRQCDAGRVDDGLMTEMFRSAHSLKGLSAMLGLHEINDLTHRVENVFDAARSDQLQITGDCVELLFQAYDGLVGLIGNLREPKGDPTCCVAVIEQISCLLKSTGNERAQTTQADAESFLDTADAAALQNATPSDETASGAQTADTRSEQPTATDSNSDAERVAAPELAQDYLAGIVDEGEIPPKYLAIFVDETEMSLDSLTETLLALEDNSQVEGAIENLLITAHRIKGGAAAVGLNRGAKLAHHMEDVVQSLREGVGCLSHDVVDALLKCTDGLRHYVQTLKDGRAESTGFSELCHELVCAYAATQQDDSQAAQEVPQGSSAAETPDPSPTDGPTHVQTLADAVAAIQSHAPAGSCGLVGRIRFVPDFPLISLKAQLAVEKIKRAGSLFHCEPSADALEWAADLESLTFGVCTERDLAELERELSIAGVERIDLEPYRLGGPKESASKSDPSRAANQVDEPDSAPTANANPDANSAPKICPPSAAAESASRDSDAAKPRTNGESSGGRPAETLRVDIDRLDQLMNLAGQLVITKARFAQIGDLLKGLDTGRRCARSLANSRGALNKLVDTSSGGSRGGGSESKHVAQQIRRVQCDLEGLENEVLRFDQAHSAVSDLLDAVHQLDRISHGIQKSVMDTRMVPIGPLFGRFRRVVRDITRGNQKEIRIEIRGEKTELDKRMIDELGDPLIHMVRNSADHGVESPDDRQAAGKPRQGTITLDAYHRGNSIIIQVADDGQGLDAERIKHKAIEKGMVTAPDADKMSQHQIFQLIWEPGFSTAAKVTEISGRGMGMDIVRSKIEDLSGQVDVESTPGAGSTFTIKLPLTMAILPSLMAEVDGDVFALPMETVVEIVGISRRDLVTVHNELSVRVRERVVPVVPLEQILTWNVSPTACQATPESLDEADQVTLLILKTDEQEIGIPVDRLLGEEDVVIKSMAENYQNVEGIAGASILGDGRVSLILDVGALIQTATQADLAAAATE